MHVSCGEQGKVTQPDADPARPAPGTLRAAVEAFERQEILRVVAERGSWRATADALGISLRTLLYKRSRYGLPRRKPKGGNHRRAATPSTTA